MKLWHPPLIFAGALALLLAACGGAAQPAAAPPSSAPASQPASAAAGSADAKLAQLYQAAKKDGQVIWGSNTVPERQADLVAAFNKHFPGVKLTTTVIDATSIGQRLLTEAAAKRISVDVATSNLAAIDPLLQRDMLVTHDFSGAGIDPKDIGLGGKLIWYQDPVVAWLYNTRLVSAADVPKKWEDFLNPKWNGKMNFIRSGAGWHMLQGIWDEAKIHTYIQSLAKLNPVPVATPQEGLSKVATGESWVTNASTLDNGLHIAATQGAAVAPVPLSPMYDSPAGEFTIKGIAHPAAAELFMVWMTTAEPKKLLAAQGIGRVSPCGPLPIDQYLCGKNIDIYYIDTLAKADEAGRLRPLYAKDAGLAG